MSDPGPNNPTTPTQTQTTTAPNPSQGSASSVGSVASTGSVDNTGSVGNDGTTTASGIFDNAPEPFDPEKIKLPEGFEPGEDYPQFLEIAKEFKLTNEKAQQLVDLHGKAVNAAISSLTADWQKTQNDWTKEVQADPEIGGAKLEGVKQTIAKVLDNPELTDPKFREVVIMTGVGNNPAFVRTMHRWAKALTEGGPTTGGAPDRNPDGTAKGAKDLSIAERLYGPDGPHTGGPKLGG